jgi:Ulp1 family protease
MNYSTKPISGILRKYLKKRHEFERDFVKKFDDKRVKMFKIDTPKQPVGSNLCGLYSLVFISKILKDPPRSAKVRLI